MIRFASLGSGSRGNALLVAAGATRLLVDCGFSRRTTLERLGRLGESPEALDGILVTHEHSDHIGGAFALAAHFGIPLFLTHGTALAAERSGSPVLGGSATDCRLIDSHTVFSIGDLEILPYPVPHDAREPVQFVFSDGNRRLGVLTDCGSVTAHVISVLDGSDALVLECNHDAEMLAGSDYPPHLKRRIAGNQGHLANSQAADLLRAIDRGRLHHVVAAHLSEQNNRPELAVAAVAAALGCSADWVGVADQDQGFDWREIR